MGSPSPARAGPVRTASARATRLVAGAIVVLATSGCHILSVHGGPTGPTIGGADRPGTGAPQAAQICTVHVSNETGAPLDVTWIVQSAEGATRRGSLGRIERGDSRSTTVRCGETFTAFGRGGGRDVQGSIVARQLDDNWIHLVESGSMHPAASRFDRPARQHPVRGHVVPAGACNPRTRVGVQRIARSAAIYDFVS